MVYLMLRDREKLIQMSINSIYLISNRSLLSLFLAIVISRVVYYADFCTLSFVEYFFISRSIFGGYINLKYNSFYVSENIFSSR